MCGVKRNARRGPCPLGRAAPALRCPQALVQNGQGVRRGVTISLTRQGRIMVAGVIPFAQATGKITAGICDSIDSDFMLRQIIPVVFNRLRMITGNVGQIGHAHMGLTPTRTDRTLRGHYHTHMQLCTYSSCMYGGGVDIKPDQQRTKYRLLEPRTRHRSLV